MIKQLEEIGLTNGEARVYKALSQLGASSVGPISDLSKVHRSIIYQILEKLIEKGLVTYIIEGKIKKYQAAPPTMLLNFLEKEKEKLETKEETINELMPTILQMQSQGKKASATIYSGFSGILTATFNILDKLKTNEEYYMINIPAFQPEHHHINWEKFQVKREKLKIFAKQLYNPKVKDEILKERNSHKYIDARRMPIDFGPPSYYIVYQDTTIIALSQGSQPMAIEIVNQEIADGFKAYCDWLWKKSKPFKK